MARKPNRLDRIERRLALHGLMVSGIAPLDPKDGFGKNGSALLISPDEPAFWDIYKTSTEASDNRPDPMDRWSKRVLMGLAADTQARAIFPSDGPPYPPFFTWALRSGSFWSSPISLLVHETAGLFTSFRGALLIEDSFETATHQSPCTTCAAPCKTACPVEAFASGYDVDACKTNLRFGDAANCLSQGCNARRACPVGQNRRIPEQSAFHMESFL